MPNKWNCQISWLQDKKYATDKYKDIYTELSIVKAKAERDQGRLRDQLQLAHEALGEPTLEEVERGGYGTEGWKTPGCAWEQPGGSAYCSEQFVASACTVGQFIGNSLSRQGRPS